jgi:hypothetical protein
MDRASGDAVPRAVAWLGYGGLVPFFVLAVAIFADRQRAPFWSDALFAYGAVILSFVGALHWGFAMTLGGLSAGQRDVRLPGASYRLAGVAGVAAPALPWLLLVAGFGPLLQDRLLAGMPSCRPAPAAGARSGCLCWPPAALPGAPEPVLEEPLMNASMLADSPHPTRSGVWRCAVSRRLRWHALLGLPALLARFSRTERGRCTKAS